MPEPKRRMLDADGELSDELTTAGEPLFCNECGSPNAPNARFCRKCGHSLEEQEADIISYASQRLAKTKNAQAQAIQSFAAHSDRNAAILQLFTMLFVGSMAITGLVSAGGANAGLLLFVLLAWFLVEGVRGGTRNKITIPYVITSIITMAFVTGMTITAFVAAGGDNAGLSLIVMLAWFLVEGVRAEAQSKAN